MIQHLSRLGRVVKIAAVIVVLASPAAAQTAASSPAAEAPPVLLGTPAFAQLVQGKNVIVTSADGTVRQGRVTSLSATGMTVDSRPVLFSQIARVDKVSHRVRNYTLAGLTTGFIVGFVAYEHTDCEAPVDEGCGQIFGYTALGTVGGVALGVILNHTLRDRDLIYSARKRTTTMALAPIVSRTRKGVAFTMTWR